MGFLAYLLVGGIVGAAACYYFPGFSPRNKAKSSRKTTKWVYLWGILLGVLGAILASYGGQIMGLFTSAKCQNGPVQSWGLLFCPICIFYIDLESNKLRVSCLLNPFNRMLLMSEKIIICFSKVPTASLITWINKWLGCFVYTKTRRVGRFQD